MLKAKRNTQGWNLDNSYARLPLNFYTQIAPTPVSDPRLVILNLPLAEQLGLALSELPENELVALLCGNRLPQGATPIAQAYAGHQFGHFTYLGDGRAHLLGEQLTPDGRRVDIQLKGSGQTPYSRRGDGRAALGPMLREYLISEAMHALGIPSTRSLAVVTTGELIQRDHVMPGAILTRIASSHIRVGTFAGLAMNHDLSGLKILADYTIARHYPEVQQATNPYIALLKAIIERQADLIVHWMRVGFIHGVMNTDNMAVSGETIDYGPCAFMDNYDPDTVFSSIDSQGRYRYANQPGSAQWNLARLAEALLPLIDEDSDTALEQAKQAISEFSILYENKWLNMMRSKLGLFGDEQGDYELILELLQVLHEHRADYTNTFRELAYHANWSGGVVDSDTFRSWHQKWQKRLAQNNRPLHDALNLMNANNPAVIPRNHQVNRALESAEQGDLQAFHNLLNVLKEPYTNTPAMTAYQAPPKADECVKYTFCGT